MDYGFITNKNMILDYEGEDDFILQAWYLDEMIIGASRNLVVIYQHCWGNSPPTGISIVSEKRFIEEIEWNKKLINSLKFSWHKESARKEMQKQNE